MTGAGKRRMGGKAGRGGFEEGVDAAAITAAGSSARFAKEDACQFSAGVEDGAAGVALSGGGT